jgi:Zn-dependent peptidase ImmA (M78 family)
VADRGVALMLLDANDSDDEQRFSLAHELAHLLLHYLRPRREALAVLGPDILPVLDRRRAARPTERFAAAMRRVHLRPYQHAMERPGHMRPEVSAMEYEADAGAMELLCPRDDLQGWNLTEVETREALCVRYGLPSWVAARMACQIVPSSRVDGVLRFFVTKSTATNRVSLGSREEDSQEHDDDEEVRSTRRESNP